MKTRYSSKFPIRVIFIGTTELGVPALRLLREDPRFEVAGVVTQPDKPAGRGLKLKAPAIKTTALDLGLELIQPESLRVKEVVNVLKVWKPDVIVTAAYGLWIPDDVFDMTPKRCLNLHPSLLPRHRGAAPVVSSIIAGEPEAGISVLFVEDEMDAGDLLGQIKIHVGEEETTESVMKRCAVEGGPFFVETIYNWMTDKITPRTQDHEKQTWFGRMEKSEGLIDWNLPAVEIARRVRALTPWPGTYTFFNGKRLIIRKAFSLDNTECPSGNTEILSESGRIMDIASKICVSTGNGLLELKELQLEYRNILPINDFLNGQTDFIGSTLG